MNKYSEIESFVKLENKEVKEQEKSFDLVHVGVILAYMAITATILLLLFTSFDNKPLGYGVCTVGKAEPV